MRLHRSPQAQKQKTIEAEDEHKRKIEELCSIASNEAVATDTRREALNKLEMKYPDIFAKYDTEYEKLKNIILLVFLMMSFNNVLLNYIWHGFHDQYGIPNRFSFLFIFVLLSMGYEAVVNIDRKQVVGVMAGIIVLEERILLEERCQRKRKMLLKEKKTSLLTVSKMKTAMLSLKER